MSPWVELQFQETCFRYNMDSGELLRLYKGSGSGFKPGWNICSPKVNSSGYRKVVINQTEYLQHRLIWYMIKGQWPNQMIDHINGIRSDNSWNNLREVSARDNCLNRSRHRAGHLPGTYYDNKQRKWIANIRFHLGAFNSVEEAQTAYLNAYELLKSKEAI